MGPSPAQLFHMNRCFVLTQTCSLYYRFWTILSQFPQLPASVVSCLWKHPEVIHTCQTHSQLPSVWVYPWNLFQGNLQSFTPTKCPRSFGTNAAVRTSCIIPLSELLWGRTIFIWKTECSSIWWVYIYYNHIFLLNWSLNVYLMIFFSLNNCFLKVYFLY